MFTSLSIDRFKSIRSLSIPCRKVNLFIGAPDTGKTNILDALAFCSQLGWGIPVGTMLRLRPEIGFDALFFRKFFDQPFLIRTQADETTHSLDLQVTIHGHDRGLIIDSKPADKVGVTNLLTPEQVSQVIEMGASVFFNLDDFLA